MKFRIWLLPNTKKPIHFAYSKADLSIPDTVLDVPGVGDVSVMYRKAVLPEQLDSDDAIPVLTETIDVYCRKVD